MMVSSPSRSSPTGSRTPPGRQERSRLSVCAVLFFAVNVAALAFSWQQLRDLYETREWDSAPNLRSKADSKDPIRRLVVNGDASTALKEGRLLRDQNLISDSKENLSVFDGTASMDHSFVVLTGLIADVAEIANSTLAQLVHLNCQYHVAVHILTAKGTGSANLKSLRDDYERCAPFVILRQNRNVKEIFPNRIDRIAYLRDIQRNDLRRRFVDPLSGDEETKASILSKSVIVVLDLDMKTIPSNDELVREVHDMGHGANGADVLCAGGQMMNPPGYYDMFATILYPNSFVYPLSGRLIDHFMPGEEETLVRSDDIYGGNTQLDLMEFFDKQALRFPDGAIPVKSCFGGLAMYRASKFFVPDCKYGVHSIDLIPFANKEDARPCEHVVFHHCLLQQDLSTTITMKPAFKTFWDEATPPRSEIFSGLSPVDDRLVTFKKAVSRRTTLTNGTFSLVIDETGSVVLSDSSQNATSPTIVWKIGHHHALFHEDWEIMTLLLKENGMLVLEQQVKEMRPEINPQVCQPIDEGRSQQSCRIELWSSGTQGSPAKTYSLGLTASGTLEVKESVTGTIIWSNQDMPGDLTSTPHILTRKVAESSDCIGSGDETTINRVLDGVGAEAALCPGAVFNLNGPVVFSADSQKVYTQGVEEDDTLPRALLSVADPSVATAITMVDRSYTELLYVLVDGNRKNLGHVAAHFHGGALIDAGGTGSVNQRIAGIKALDPRSFAVIHVIEGAPSDRCKGAVIEDNEIGPAGDHSLAHRENADGISYACTSGHVRNNLVEDTTNGGIVVFGAPGTIIEGNLVRASTRSMLGGISMVNYEPYEGNYKGTSVQNNVIEAKNVTIHVALGMGGNIWQCSSERSQPLYGGIVLNNTLVGTHMGYGYAVNGVKDWVVLENKDRSTHVGEPTEQCGGRSASFPEGFQIERETSRGIFQAEFNDASLDSLVSAWQIRELRDSDRHTAESFGGPRSMLMATKNIQVEDQLDLAAS